MKTARLHARRAARPALVAGLVIATAVLMLVLGAGAVCAPRATAAPMSWDGQTDIGALMDEARQTWNLAEQDAVILLDHARMTYGEDGRLRQERHRVVWVGSDWAQDNFADLRVPWDSERQKFTVQALRVWRDQRWIDARPTAVVETTPYALRSAPDYTGIHETMLLHDGVEIPCILECDYVIEDTVAPRGWTGWEDGQWIFPQSVPVVESQLILESPADKPLQVHAPVFLHPASAAEPAVCVPTLAVSSPRYAASCFQMRKLDAAPLPTVSDPASASPHVQWSAFADWQSLGDAIAAAFESGLELDAALRDSLATLVEGAPNGVEKTRRILGFVHRSTRRINYDLRFFAAHARPVSRVFDTAYGADLDLARLAAALMKEAGVLRVQPAFIGRGPFLNLMGEVMVPALARFGAVGLWIQDGAAEAFGDLSAGVLRTAGSGLTGRALWAPSAAKPNYFPEGSLPLHEGRPGSACDIACDLRWDPEKKSWSGNGWLMADGHFNPYDDLARDPAAARERLDGIVSGVLEGLAVQDYSPVQCQSGVGVELRFDLKPGAAARDTLGRLPVVIGAPAGGLLDALPDDIELSESERGSPAFPGALSQTVRVTLALGGLEIVRLPEPVAMQNAAGHFELTVEHQNGKVTITRKTWLTKPEVMPLQWPALRALLLADADPGNRTVLLR